MRQLAKPDGAVALSVSYTPWGDTLEVYGTGMLDIGYLGGVYDAGTGLIYMGNGQYYDPSTGRFLTRGMKQESTNPYTPWNNDPVGMLIGPFGFLALLFAKKKKHTKLDAIIVVVILLALMGFGSSIAMPVQANSTTTSTYGGFTMPSVPMSYASSPQPATYKATIVANPGAPVEIHTTDELCGIPDFDQIGAGITGFFENLADGYIQGWKNFFTAFEILFSPDSLLWQKNLAFTYILFWGGAHYVLAAGLVMLAVVGYQVIVLGIPFCVANGTCDPNKYGNLNRAAEFGTLPYNQLKDAIKQKGLNIELQAHHIIEQRFAPALNQLKSATSKWVSVAVTPQQHQWFTNQWREAIGYSNKLFGLTTKNVTLDDIWYHAQKIYEHYPALLEAAKIQLGK